MHTLTVEDLARQPQRLLEDAERGEPSLVTRLGEPVMLAVPLAAGLDTREVRLELAALCTSTSRSAWGWRRASPGCRTAK
jgi:antitoxin (DNA-binding transcriptional repressor) of toxin-antitoxin stability system